jgi:5'-phosphate synthase pdxT subunit
MRIGVLAAQGDVSEHREILRAVGVEEAEIRLPDQLEGLDGLIIPGGESTTIGRLMARYGFDRAIPERVSRGMAVYGTCAGMILLARRASGGDAPLLHLMDIGVIRNAYGRQADSFEADLEIPLLGPPALRGVFIRAPMIDEVGPAVEVLASLNGHPVLARQGRLLVSSFHPELVPDDRVHRYFIDVVRAGN